MSISPAKWRNCSLVACISQSRSASTAGSLRGCPSMMPPGMISCVTWMCSGRGPADLQDEGCHRPHRAAAVDEQHRAAAAETHVLHDVMDRHERPVDRELDRRLEILDGGLQHRAEELLRGQRAVLEHVDGSEVRRCVVQRGAQGSMVACTRAAVREMSATANPSRAKRRATAAPRPDPAPMMASVGMVTSCGRR